MMNHDERTESAIAVAWAIFDLFQVVGDETIYDINRAIDLIEAYRARQVRESWRPRRAKVIPLRVVRR
jgi:hypothetical protein